RGEPTLRHRDECGVRITPRATEHRTSSRPPGAEALRRSAGSRDRGSGTRSPRTPRRAQFCERDRVEIVGLLLDGGGSPWLETTSKQTGPRWAACTWGECRWVNPTGAGTITTDRRR